MKRLLFPLCLLVFLVGAPSAMAADVPIPNAGGENPDTTGSEATDWGQSKWGTLTANFTRPTGDAHSGTRSLRLEVSGYASGDAKWAHKPVPVTGGKYYQFSDWYKSTTDSTVSMFWQTAQQASLQAEFKCGDVGQPVCGTWANLETGVESSSAWKKFESGIDMPADAVQAQFMHLIADDGSLQTDDYKLEQLDSPAGFKRPLVSLTFDDSTPNLYDYVIPELDKLGYKSTQYVVTGATGARDDNNILYQWDDKQIKDVHQRGHEIGSHTEFHPNLAKPGPTTVCEGKDAANLPIFKAPTAGVCDTGWTQKSRNGSWLDPFGGTNLWLRPATIGSPNQDLADTTLAQELGDSKRKLEGHIGYGVPTIAYPFGSYDSTVVAAEKALGYKAGRSVDEGYNSKIGLNRFKIKVQNIQQAVCTDKTTGVVTKTGGTEDAPTCGSNQTMSADTTTKQFKDWVEKARANNYWLVLVYHPVDDLGVNPYGTSTKRFGEQMKAIKDAGIEVKTMRDALNEVMPQTGQDWAKVPSPTDLPVDPGPIPGPIPGPNPNPPSDHVVVPPPTVIPPTINPPAQTTTTDTVRPMIRVSSPTRRSYRRGSKVRASFKCLDNLHVVTCKGTVRKGARIDTRTRGRKQFKVVASDRAGNSRSVTITYRVR